MMGLHNQGGPPMFPRPLARSRRVLLGAGLVTAGLLASPLSAHAAITCRADPIVTLSNGMQVQMSDLIYDYASNVSKVAYTLHGPVGTTVTSVSYANTDPGIVETFQYVADNGAGNYDSYAAIYDTTPQVNVQYYTTVTNTATGASLSQSAQTHLSASGAVLHIHLHL
jgi:hypothetical protein